MALQHLESTARDIAPELKTIKGFAITCLNDLGKNRCGLPQQPHSAKQGLQNNKDIIILKADKGSKIVMLNKEAYISAGEDMLADANVYDRLTINPLSTESAKFNSKLDDIFKDMPAGKTPTRFRSWLPNLPFLKLNPKIHKPGLPFRPIVSQSKSFQKPLAKHLAKILTPLLGSFSPAHLRDFVCLKEVLLAEADPKLPFLSLDVESLFTNVPVEPLLDFLKRKHEQGGVPLPEGYTIDGLLDLIRLCCSSTVFSFNGKYYRQKQGVAMGSPLAPIVACLYMEYFETEHLLSIRGPQPSFWVRFIDDILLQWAHGIEEFNIFLRKLNNIELLINLKVEWESFESNTPDLAIMPFLDLNIIRSPQCLKFGVYRKPTNTDLYTHFYSSHPTSTKKGTLISLFLRGHRLCSPEHLQK